jgi:hypothetical protein
LGYRDWRQNAVLPRTEAWSVELQELRFRVEVRSWVVKVKTQGAFKVRIKELEFRRLKVRRFRS